MGLSAWVGEVVPPAILIGLGEGAEWLKKQALHGLQGRAVIVAAAQRWGQTTAKAAVEISTVSYLTDVRREGPNQLVEGPRSRTAALVMAGRRPRRLALLHGQGEEGTSEANIPRAPEAVPSGLRPRP